MLKPFAKKCYIRDEIYCGGFPEVPSPSWDSENVAGTFTVLGRDIIWCTGKRNDGEYKYSTKLIRRCRIASCLVEVEQVLYGAFYFM